MLNFRKHTDVNTIGQTTGSKAIAFFLLLLFIGAPYRGRSEQVAANTVRPSMKEGALVSVKDLLEPAPIDENHLMARPVTEEKEGEISSRPSNTKILVVHYRAATKLGPSDDRIVLATPENNNYRVLKILDSDATEVNGELSSLDDFDVRFVSFRGLRFLYVQDRMGKVSNHYVYIAANKDQLVEVPIADPNPGVLNNHEELRNGHCELGSDGFQCEAGIYVSKKDSECCPSGGTYHWDLKLAREFSLHGEKHDLTPQFQFVVTREWRTPE